MNRSERPRWYVARFAAALCVALPLAFHFVPSVGAGVDNAERPRTFERGVVIRLEGPISPLSERYLLRKLKTAEDRRADLVIIEIDSPGGFLDASLRIAERLRDLDWAHTVAFVPSQALSGAAIVALACDEIIMAPPPGWGTPDRFSREKTACSATLRKRSGVSLWADCRISLAPRAGPLR